MERTNNKHSFFTIALAVVFILKFLFLLPSFVTPAFVVGPFVLEGAGKIAYLVALLLIALAVALGYIRRTGWAFPASLALAGYDLVIMILNRFVFTALTDAQLRAALDKAPENPMLSKESLYSLTKLMMNVSFVLALVITAAIIVFIFLARKNLEKNRII